MVKIFDSDLQNDGLSRGKRLILGVQHTFTMFGATVLVPLLTGMNVSVALFMVGIGTLIFHVITKGQVPAFMGSSFAFITPVIYAASRFGPAQAQGGLVVAGVVYLLFGILVYFVGVERVMSFFPPVVTGPIIMVIGLNLAPTAIGMASEHWGLAAVAFIIVVAVNLYTKGFIKVLPVLFGLVGGYLVAVLTGNVDFTAVQQAKLFGLPEFTMAEFRLDAIMAVAPVAVCTVVEHVGDVVAIGATCERDFIRKPGLHRTLLGDGCAIVLSAMFGGPANTTYSENTGVLALTRVFNPVIMRIAALFSIFLSVVPVLGEVIASIPKAVIGGISIVLFGMIASVGARTLIENKVNFQSSRNLIIAGVIFVLGLSGLELPVVLGEVRFIISGMALAAIVGIVLNKVFPKEKVAEQEAVEVVAAQPETIDS